MSEDKNTYTERQLEKLNALEGAERVKLAAKFVKRNAKRSGRSDAMATLKKIVDASGDAGAITALKTIRPSLYGIGRQSGPTNQKSFITLVLEKKTVSEMDVFNMFKAGRKECAVYIRRALKKAAPEDRVWINFDEAKGNYVLIGKGPEAPKGYTGYTLSEENVDLD